MRLRSIIGSLVVATVAIVCVRFAPTNLGGSTTYVSTHGTSMSPRFHAGDLAVVQPVGKYHVGDIAAYHSTTLRDAIVLHRIIAINDGHVTFKGDNNNFVDPDHPTVGQLVGRLAIRVPRGGIIRASLARPVVLFPILVILLTCATTGVQRKRRRKARAISNGRLQARPSAPRANPRRRLGVVVPVAASVATAGFLVAAVAVWNIPQSEAATTHETYRQSLSLGYSGKAPKGTAYPDGRITTGDPVFTRLVTRVDVDLDYAFSSDAAGRNLRGTYQVMMNVESPTGLSRSLPLTPTRRFTGAHWHAGSRLDLDRVRALETQFSEETGLATSQATISVAALVRVNGDLAHTSFSDTVKAKMGLQLDADKMITSAGADAPGTTRRNGSVATAAVRTGELSLWRLHLSAQTARIALLALFALALAAAATVLSTDRCRVALGEVDAIMRRHGRLLIAVSAVPPAGDRVEVHVESMRALALLAEAHEHPIVHAEMSGRHRFALSTDSTVYCYETAPAPRPAARQLVAA